MITQGGYQQRRCMEPRQLYWNILKALLLALLINGDYGADGQHHRRNFQCHEEGYHADPHNCQMYYRCVAWGNNSPLTKFDFKCGPGTVFSHANGDICVHPRESERSECQESENDLDSNMNYPQSNGGSIPSYGQSDTIPSYGRPPAESSYQQPQASPNYEKPNKPNYGEPSYGLPQSSPSYGRPTATPDYRPPKTSPTYGPSYPTPSSLSTESPSMNEIDQPAHLPASQAPSSSSQSLPLGTATDNSIPHPISTTSVASISTSQSQCQQEGFFAHPNDCEKFFRCVDAGQGSYLKYDFTCGEGTVWDPAIEGCNHAWAVNRDGCSTSSHDGDSDSDGNNGQNIDQSQSGGGDLDNVMTSSSPWEPTATQAPSYPSYLPPESPNGDSISNATTTGPSSPEQVSPFETTSQSPSSISPPSSTSLETQPSTPTPPGFTSSPSSGLANNGSPPESGSTSPATIDSSSSSECLEEGFFADPKDCMKFYRCVGEVNSLKKYDFTCGEGTAWDQNIQGCNHKYAVSSCSGKDHSSDQTTASSGVDQPNPSAQPDKDPETSAENKGENQLGVTTSPSSSEVPTTVEESSNPSSSQISTNVEEPSSSPSPPAVSTTDEGSTNAPSENTREPDEITETTTTTLKPTTAAEKPSASATTSSDPDENQETSTQQINGNESGTTDQSSPSTTSESSSVGESLSPSSSTTPTTDSSDSSTLEELSSSKPEQSSEPSTPQEQPSSTTASSSSSSPNKPNGSAECQEEGFSPDPTDCRKFYRCVSTGENKFTKYTFNCAPGTAWDQSILTCNYIEKVTSCGSESNEIPSGPGGNVQTSQEPVTESMSTSTTSPKEEHENKIPITSTSNSNKEENNPTKAPSSSSTESNNVGNNESSTAESPNKETTQKTNGTGDCTTSKPINNGIVCDVAGFNANPTHCDKFYRCVDNGKGFNVYHFDCPPGTIFDPSIEVCNYPESVYPPRKCDGGEVGTGTSPAETSGSTESTIKPSAATESSDGSSTTTETSSESGTTSTGPEETSTESTSEIIGGAETSTESATELIGGEETSKEPTTELNETTEDAAGGETTVGEGTTSPTTEAALTEMQPTTEQSVESGMTTETSMTTEVISESSSAMTDMPTEAAVTEMSESTTTALESTTEEKTDVDNIATPCAVGNLTDDQIVLVCPTGFRRHPKYCNMFYQCSNEDEMKIKILVLGCPEGTIYDEEKIQCKPESESSRACDTQLATSRVYRQLEKNSVSPVRVRRNTLCPDEGHYPYQQGCSNAFYKCKKNTRNELQGYLYRCPKDFVYWSVSRRCERPNRMICSHDKYEDNERIYSWENRWELPMEQFNLSS